MAQSPTENHTQPQSIAAQRSPVTAQDPATTLDLLGRAKILTEKSIGTVLLQRTEASARKPGDDAQALLPRAAPAAGEPVTEGALSNVGPGLHDKIHPR